MLFFIGLLKKIPMAKAGPIAAILAGFIIVASIGYKLGWWRMLQRSLGPWFWIGLLVLVVVGLVVAALLLLPRYREKRFLSHLRSEDEQTPADEVQENLKNLRAKMLEGIRILQNAPELRKTRGLKLYALPWYMLLGASQSGKTTLLQGIANDFLPFASPTTRAEGPTQACDWWFFNTAIMLDTAGFYAFPADIEREGAQWYRFLQLLRHYRELQPINGVVLTVAADTLVSHSAEELRQEASELRKRVEEAIRELEINFPIYLLVTRCDLLEGFTTFFDCLPERTAQQALGYVQELPPLVRDNEVQVTFHFEAVFTSFVERLQQIRLSLLNDDKLLPDERRQEVFCFPEEFAALQQPLGIFLDPLLRPNPYQHTPFFRGLFFCSATQQGAPVSFLRRELHMNGQYHEQKPGKKTYFLHDLCTTIWPRDAYLVKNTGKRKRAFKHLFGLGLCVALCALLALLLSRDYLRDQRRLTTVDMDTCTATAPQEEPRLRLVETERCRRAVQAFSERPRPAWRVFKRSEKLAQQLRQRYVAQFEAQVLLPVDARLAHHLDAGTDTLPLVFLLIRRIEFLTMCLAEGTCPDPLPPAWQSDYPLMLDPTQQSPAAPEQVATLQLTHEAYLKWTVGAPERWQGERQRHAELLQQWFAAQQFMPKQILRWANDHYKAVTASVYWDLPSASHRSGLTQVEGAYTRAAWQESILPFVERARDTVPDTAPLLKTFQQEYQRQYFTRWERFLQDFSRGEGFWKGSRAQRQKLTVTLLSERSPYNRLLDAVAEQLQPFLPQAVEAAAPVTSEDQTAPAADKALAMVMAKAEPEAAASEAPAWARLLQRYVDSDSRKAYLEALKQVGEFLEGATFAEQSFYLARAGFQGGSATVESIPSVLKASIVVGQFRDQEGSGSDEEALFWPLLQRPITFAWQVILAETGAYLQQRWRENVLAPSEGLADLERLEFLYGPQGRVREFADQFAKPFLSNNESQARVILKEKVPLSVAFLDMLREERQLRPLLELGRRTPHRITVEATRSATIDSQTSVREEMTEFVLECASKAYTITKRPQDLSGALAPVFWSFDTCSDVAITVVMSCDSLCVERAAAVDMHIAETSSLRVSKRYTGQRAFLNFIEDFADGEQTYRLHDFADSYPATLRAYGVNVIRVFYRVSVPPALQKLLSLETSSLVAPTIIQ